MLRKRVKQMDEDLREAFDNVAEDNRSIWYRINKWAELHKELRREFDVFRRELSNNGVVRDLRAVEKRLEAREEDLVELYNRLDKLNTNGVATAINRLNAEVFKDKKESQDDAVVANLQRIWGLDSDAYRNDYEPTLAGKVNAIIEHLGLDLEVAPEEVKKAKVVAKKKAAPKKKGRR